jgi:hypothetical protein
LLDVVHWIRQIIAILFGLCWGILDIRGAVGLFRFRNNEKIECNIHSSSLLSYILISALITFLYYTKYLNVDDEELGRSDLLQEGFFSAFTLFLVRQFISILIDD